jgi:hypothetical protein
MSESWGRVRRRYALMEEVLAHVDRAGPAALPQWRERIEAEYDGEGLGGFLRDVQRRWHRAFDARLDAVLESDPPDPAGAVAELWQTLAASQPATRLVLDAYAGHAALGPAEARHRRMLRLATGVDLAQVRAESQGPTGGVTRRTCPLAAIARARRRRHRRHEAPQAA